MTNPPSHPGSIPGLVGIGGARKHPLESETPVELLVACHGRIRQFTALATRLAAATGESAAQVSEAALQVHRYFTVALPLHQRDEDELVAPALRSARASDVVCLALDEVTREHREIDALLDELAPKWEMLARSPERLPSLRPSLGAACAELESHWQVHLPLEERTVFPALDEFVPEGRRRALLEAMRARRSHLLRNP